MGAVIDVRTINSRSGIGWRVTYSVAVALARVETDAHPLTEVNLDDPPNISVLLAFE